MPFLRSVVAAWMLVWATTACASVLFPLHGPARGTGLSRYEAGLRHGLVSGRYDRMIRELDEGGDRLGDELLRLQFRGLVAHYAGRSEESSRDLEDAALLAEDRFTRSVSRQALSLLTSDRVLPYRPGAVERLLIHHYGALNYLHAGRPEEAAVEARRLARLLDRVDDGAPDWAETPAGRGLRSALHLLTAAVFEAAGEWNDAEVAYRLSERVAAGGPGDSAAGAGLGVDSRATGGDELPGAGSVLLVVEHGFAPYRVERSATALLTRDRVDRLRRETERAPRLHESITAAVRPDGGADSPTASEELARELLAGSARTRRGHPISERRYLQRDEIRFLRVAWPELAPPVSAPGVRTVSTAAGRSAVPGRSIEADLAGALAAEFRDGQVGRLARTLVRAAAKQLAVEAVSDAGSEDEREWRELAGTVASVVTAAVERADTRCWHLLPARLSVHRLRLPPGTHELVLELDGAERGGSRRMVLDPVHVSPGRVTVVTRRVWPASRSALSPGS